MMQKDKCLILSLLHSKMHSERSWNSFFTVSLYFSAGEYQCMTKTINNCTNCIFWWHFNYYWRWNEQRVTYQWKIRCSNHHSTTLSHAVTCLATPWP